MIVADLASAVEALVKSGPFDVVAVHADAAARDITAIIESLKTHAPNTDLVVLAHHNVDRSIPQIGPIKGASLGSRAQSSDARRNTESASSSDRRHRILLADDDPDLLRLVGEILRQEGYEVSTAADGEEATLGALA